MTRIIESKIYRALLNTTAYKSAAVAALMLSPAAPFCFVAPYISIILLLWGAFILVNDLFGERKFAKAPYSMLLLGFVVSYCVTLVLFIENDIVSTFNVFFWAIIEFFLLYAFWDSKELKSIFNELYKINITLTIVALAASVVSLLLIFFRITVFMPDPEGLNRAWIFGVVGERSSGIFNNAIPFASCTFIGFVAALWNLVTIISKKQTNHKKAKTVFYSVAVFINYICMQTTFTRSFVYTAYVAIGCAAFASLFFILKDKKNLIIRIGAGILAAAVLVGVMYGTFLVSKQAIPAIANLSEGKFIILNDDMAGMTEEEIKSQFDLSDEVTMDRTQYGQGFLGPRADIWRVMLDVIPHSPIFGFTSGNRGPTSLEYDTTGYVEKGFPNGGIPTYHNAYIDVIVSAGFLGFAIILAFLILNIAATIRVIFSKKTSFQKQEAIHYSLLAAICATHVFIVCLFLGQLVFANISTCLYFWVCLGALAKANEIIGNKENGKLKMEFLFSKLLKPKKED